MTYELHRDDPYKSLPPVQNAVKQQGLSKVVIVRRSK